MFILNNECKYFRLARTFTRISLKPRNEQILDYTFEWTLKIQHPSTRDVNVFLKVSFLKLVVFKKIVFQNARF